MGYTNYYTQSTDFTDKEWKQIKSEFEYVKDHAGDIIEIQYDEKDYIQFNGTNGCESFCLNKHAKTEKERKYKWSFIGTPHKSSRQDLLFQLSQINPFFCYKTFLFRSNYV